MRERHGLLLSHERPGLQDPRAGKRAHVVHAIDEQVQESLLGAKQRRVGVGRGPVLVPVEGSGGGAGAREVPEDGDKRGPQRVRLAVQVRQEERDVRHRRLWHALGELGDEHPDASHTHGVGELLALVLCGIDGANLAEQGCREARILVAIGGGGGALGDRAGEVLVLVEEVHKGRGDVLELAPLERARAEHIERGGFGHLASQRRLRFHRGARERGEHGEESLGGLPGPEEVPEVDV